MNWIIVKKFPLDTDLSKVTGFLRQRGVVHQIYEESGEQVIAVTDPNIVTPLVTLLDDVMHGKVHIDERVVQAKTQPSMPSLFDQMKQVPVTVLLILCSALGALLVYLDPDYHYVHFFTFQDFDPQSQYMVPAQTSFLAGEIWRFMTPAFLHFGFFHVLFNSLWMWDLGRRLEILLGKRGFILFFVVTAAISNVAQYCWSGPSLFGGMSGVVYALVGFMMISHRLVPHRLTAIPPAVLGFMLFWLVLCMTGAVNFFIGAGVANAAHLGGLLAGCVFAFFSRNIVKRSA